MNEQNPDATEPRLGLYGLKIQNYMCISLVELVFRKGEMCVIGGDNAAGKSTVLKAFEALVCGKRFLPAEPIRRGTKTTVIEGDLGEYTARLEITQKGGPKLTLKTKDGKPVKSPQALFNSFRTTVGFRPLEFMAMDRRAQSVVLMNLAGLDFTKTDREHKVAYDARRAVGVEVKRLEGVLSGLPFDETAPKEEKLMSEIISELDAAEAKNLANGNQRQSFQELLDEGTEIRTAGAAVRDKIAKLQDELVGLEDDHKANEQAIAEAKPKVDALKDDDVDAIRASLQDVQETNQTVRDNLAHLAAKAKLDEVKAEHATHGATLSTLDEQKASALTSATFPVDGLDLDEDNLPTFNGFSTKDISGAEQLLVSASIGLALNPDLAVLLIDDGEKLDGANMAVLGKFAQDNGAVILMARVATGEGCTVEMVDGHLALPVDDALDQLPVPGDAGGTEEATADSADDADQGDTP